MTEIKLHSRVRIVKTVTGDGVKLTGTVKGQSAMNFVKIWIVLLDQILPDGSQAVAVPETCLELLPPWETEWLYPYESVSSILQRWDELQKKYYPLPDNPINLPYAPPGTPLPNQAIGQCSKCHRDLYQVELYSCMANDCPIQPKITM